MKKKLEDVILKNMVCDYPKCTEFEIHVAKGIATAIKKAILKALPKKAPVYKVVTHKNDVGRDDPMAIAYNVALDDVRKALKEIGCI